MTGLHLMSGVDNLAKELAKNPIDAPVKHNFSEGVYVREIFMPKGMLIIGKVHKTRHLNILQSGRCTVWTPLRRFQVVGPCTFESFEGEQKIVYMHEDTVWSTVHVTDETDLAKIEDKCVASTVDEVTALRLLHQLGESV